MRYYETIWTRLKALPRKEASTVGVSITAPPVLHRRIIKAVKKEKWLDMVFKLELEDRIATLNHSRKGPIVTFTLHFSMAEEDF